MNARHSISSKDLRGIVDSLHRAATDASNAISHEEAYVKPLGNASWRNDTVCPGDASQNSFGNASWRNDAVCPGRARLKPLRNASGRNDTVCPGDASQNSFGNASWRNDTVCPGNFGRDQILGPNEAVYEEEPCLKPLRDVRNACNCNRHVSGGVLLEKSVDASRETSSSDCRQENATPKWTFKKRVGTPGANNGVTFAARRYARSKSSSAHAQTRTVSPSPHRATSPRYPHRSHLTNGSTPNGLATPTTSSLARGRTNHQSPTTNSIGQSPSSIRKWRSNADFHDGTPVRIGGGGGRTSSTTSLASSHRSLNQVGLQREPSFNSEDGYLRLYLRNRPVVLYAPTSLKDIFRPDMPLGPPDKRLTLEWVYGYRGRDCRSNIFLLPTGELLYFTAAIVVLYHVQEQMQRHYLGHTDDVKCIDVHPNRLIIASGQVSKHGTARHRRPGSLHNVELETLSEDGELLPHVRIWDSISLQTQHILGVGEFERAVSCVAFSKADGGVHLAVVDESYDHSLSIWDWQRRIKITETKSANEQVFACEWHPTDRHLLITCGKSQISFWTFDGTVVTKKLGVFEGRDRPKYVLCVAFSESGSVLSGDSNGTISIWSATQARVIKQAHNAHEGGVFSLCSLKGGRILSGGGKDRRLLEWDGDLNFTGREMELPVLAGPVRHIAAGKGNLVIVGTTHNCVMEGSIHLKNFTYIMQGHMDELWGLARHPTQPQFLTCGYDKTLRMWDSISHTLVWMKELPDGLQCCCVHPSGHVIAVATSLGKWYVMDAHTREMVVSHTDCAHIISCIDYSPDGRLLAIGSHDCSVYVYQVSDDARKYSRIGRCLGHSSLVTHLDWSSDSLSLRSNSGDHDVLFWSAKNCKALTSTDLVRDLEWATDRCTLSFNVAGIWPEGSDGADVNSADRSGDGQLLASADDYGHVKLFRFPCSQPKSAPNVYAGHSSQVASVQFLCNDSRLISIGGKDAAVFQWSVGNA